MPNNPAQARLLAVRGGDGEHLVDHVQMPRIAMNVGILFLPQASILAAFGPYSTFLLASDKEYLGASSLFWISLVVVHLESWLLLGWAAIQLTVNFEGSQGREEIRKRVFAGGLAASGCQGSGGSTP